jgi:uncharacterized protein (DUF433 family)
MGCNTSGRPLICIRNTDMYVQNFVDYWLNNIVQADTVTEFNLDIFQYPASIWVLV